jgi:hypothetical protein
MFPSPGTGEGLGERANTGTGEKTEEELGVEESMG